MKVPEHPPYYISTFYGKKSFHVRLTRVVDLHWFNAETFFLIADTDPDPVPNPGFWRPKIEKNLQL